MDSPLFTTKEAAAYLRISPRKLQYLRGRGQLDAIEFGRSVRYEKCELDAFIRKMRRRQHGVHT